MSTMEEDLNGKDQGISDVLDILKNVDVSREASQANKTPVNGRASENDTKHDSEKRGSCGDVQETPKNGNDNKPTETKPNSDPENGTLDLTNPDQVLELLETVDLTEEDTETLLQEAYNMNRKLKEMLRRQQHENDPSKSQSKSDKKKSKQNGNSSGVSSNTSLTASRMGSASLRKSVLPPIEKEGTNVYAVKLQRSRTNVVDVRSVPRVDHVTRSKSSTKESNVQTRKSKVKSTEPRAEWNNRFNYT